MKITKRSPLTGEENTLDLDIDMYDWQKWLRGGELIQNSFPYLSADEREFLLTGLLPGEWEKFLGPEEEG